MKVYEDKLKFGWEYPIPVTTRLVPVILIIFIDKRIHRTLYYKLPYSCKTHNIFILLASFFK